MTLDAPALAGGSGKRRLTAEHVAARALVEAATFAEAAPRILAAICESLEWEHGALWTVDRAANLLRCVEIWTAPSIRLPGFNAISLQSTFAPGVGLPGRVWASRQPAWIPDVVHDSNFPRAPVAAQEGLHAAFGFPILLREEVLGVMEFFSTDVRPPDDDLLSMLASVGSQIGLFADRTRAQTELDRFFTLSLDMLCVAGFDGYFRRVNPAWKRGLGYSETELLSRPFIEFVHPDDREATLEEVRNLAEGKEVIYFENRYLHHDGTMRWLMWTASPYREQQVIYAAARDITERKAAEETMASYARDLEVSERELGDQAARLAQLVKELEVARHRAEDATEAKSAFLANMSHEIRTPLNAILGMTTLALQTRLSQEQRRYLTTVKASGESLLDLINDILDFSKIEARRLDLELTAFELREEVGDAAKILALRAAEKSVELACHIEPGVPETLLGDPGRLRQVLLNVMGNAVKFTEKGEVVLAVAVERVDDGRVTLHFTVTDTGIGIPADKQEQIFLAFMQADGSTTRRYGGTGLGLAIAVRLVELMGGRMWVESEVGRGSAFHFIAVFEQPAAPGIETLRADTKALAGLRVLVVDDNATNRHILQEMLASWRMRPVSVGDAPSALAALRQAAASGQRFDAVISDCQMPVVDGFMLTRRIRRDRRLARTRIVMLTSIGHGDSEARARRAGVNAYLSKPVKHSDLLDAIATVFGVPARRARGGAIARAPKGRALRPLRILVAEDNPINLKLFTVLLKKRGHVVDAVENGRAAVAAIQAGSGRFDVVLMDLQMPEMDGIEATAAIRAREAQGGPRLPVIALTAHAMAGDRERCLAAGMDDYLSKPIDVNDLIATVERFGDPAARGPTPASAGPPTVPIFDERAALAYTGGDARLLQQVVAMFRSGSGPALKRIARALRARDAEALRMAAHSLKGAIASVGSAAGRQAAADLEDLAREGDFANATSAYETLRARIAQLEEAFVGARLAPAARSKRRTTAPRTRRTATENRGGHDQNPRRR
jgi:two-component system, sensor histidine kinase and response regulator